MILKIIPFLFILPAYAETRPEQYVELVDYVQESPDQGDVNTCLFMSNTGAMELLANKKAGIKNPPAYGPYDLSESYLMWAPYSPGAKSFVDAPVLRFNKGFGILAKDWPFEAWRNNIPNQTVWNRHPNMDTLPHIELPEVESVKLFQYGNKWSTNVLDQEDVDLIKDALWKYKSPVIVNYNDDDFWHVVLIVGYDDNLPGPCYDTDESECSSDIGSFYVRDSFGTKVELRDYDWFRVKGNAAFVIKLK